MTNQGRRHDDNMPKSKAESDRLGAQLLLAVTNLNASVDALKRTLDRDYPKRTETDSKYATKKGVKSVYKQMIFVIVMAMIVSLFVTYSILSACFLRGSVGDRSDSKFCSVMPGYDQAEENNAELIAEFRRLVEVTTENRARIERLERRIRRR